eukprot:1146252-Pelagomonas_calceolata.AAC.1
MERKDTVVGYKVVEEIHSSPVRRGVSEPMCLLVSMEFGLQPGSLAAQFAQLFQPHKNCP